jgi:hypothetical protein
MTITRTVYKPLPFREGNTIKRVYKELFIARGRYKALVTYADYLDKKNKLVEGFILYIKWL